MKIFLHSLIKSKRLHLDGWKMEFYLWFYDFLKEDIVKLFKEWKETGKFHGALNSTYISLIINMNYCDSFNKFWPISLWNLTYKFISKVITNIFKTLLPNIIFEENFGLLSNR